MTDCVFCRIARRDLPAVIVFEDAELVAFLDIGPIREGHIQIIPKAHFDTFDDLPPSLANAIVALGQRVARRLKQVYAVDRVAFLFTGGDVPHAHAHVVPLHEKTDITSARYITNDTSLSWSSEHLRVTHDNLERVRDRLGSL